MKIKMNDMLLPWIEFWNLNPVQFIIRQLKSLHKPSGRSIREYINNHVKSKICTILTTTTTTIMCLNVQWTDVYIQCWTPSHHFCVFGFNRASEGTSGQRLCYQPQKTLMMTSSDTSVWSSPSLLFISERNPLLHKTSHAPFLLCKWPICVQTQTKFKVQCNENQSLMKNSCHSSVIICFWVNIKTHCFHRSSRWTALRHARRGGMTHEGGQRVKFMMFYIYCVIC